MRKKKNEIVHELFRELKVFINFLLITSIIEAHEHDIVFFSRK